MTNSIHDGFSYENTMYSFGKREDTYSNALDKLKTNPAFFGTDYSAKKNDENRA